jgi:outer membrane protein insertion porin family
MKLYRNFFVSLLFCFFYFTLVYAENFKKSDIKIIGNKSISKETIFNYIDSKNDVLSTGDINSFQKKLFETNFFSKIEVKISGNEVFFYLNENPLVEYLIITGLEKKDGIKKAIEKILSLKENAIFSESLLNNDTKAIYEILSSSGYFKSNVKYKVNQIENNKVNIFLDINLNQQFFVNNIFFIGDKKFSTSTLKSAISTTQDSWFNFWSSTTIPSVDRINYDTSLLKKFYLSKGYYDVQIANASIDIVGKNHVNVTFAISSGSRYIFEKILINNKTASLKEKDLLFLNISSKSIEKKDYNPASINNLVKKYKDYFISNNMAVNVDYSVKKLNFDKLAVLFEIEEVSEKRFINNIVVKGNDLTEERVVRNNIFFSEGDVLSPFNIAKSKDSLQALDIFKNVSIETAEATNKNNVDIGISIEEKPTGEISAGAGYGTQGAVISFALKEKNLLGKGLTANIDMNLGTERVLGKISLTDPDFTDNGNSLRGGFFVSKFSYDNAGYENKLIGSEIATSYEAFKDVRLETGLSADMDSITSQPSASDLVKSQKGDYLSTKLFYNVYNDKRNRKYQPTSGYTTGFGQSFATFVSDIPHISNSIFGSFYSELAEDFVGTIKYRIKSINSIGDKDVKLSDRIFLSDSELRGFAFRGVGPKVGGEFIGGNYSYSTNFSTTVPNGIPDSWGARTNIFFDVANVWGTDFSAAIDSNKIRSSTGVGLEWISPLGPLTFSYAIPISKDSTDSIENFKFQLGGTF